MSTVDRPDTRTLPLLFDGQRLDQPTFHRLYEAMPHGSWAELVGGIVFMPSPLFDNHATEDFDIAGWLHRYKQATPGVKGTSNGSTILGEDSEVQPDLQLRIREGYGGQARVVGGYVVGSPELVVEVADSSRVRDLGAKKLAYEKAGVLEYLFVGLKPKEVRWFVRQDGQFIAIEPGNDGLLRSEVFPGLWLDPRALFAEDDAALIAALERGLASPEHAAFVAELARRAAGS